MFKTDFTYPDGKKNFYFIIFFIFETLSVEKNTIRDIEFWVFEFSVRIPFGKNTGNRLDVPLVLARPPPVEESLPLDVGVQAAVSPSSLAAASSADNPCDFAFYH